MLSYRLRSTLFCILRAGTFKYVIYYFKGKAQYPTRDRSKIYKCTPPTCMPY